jgi:hypothetical protein
VKTILYGHAWMSGALTAFAFFGYLRALNTSFTPPQQVWVWVSVLAVGVLWTLLGFFYVASRDSLGRAGDEPEDPAPGAGTGRPAEEVAGSSRRRAALPRYLAPLLMMVVFWAVAVLLAVAASEWWLRNAGRPRPLPALPFVNPTGSPRPLVPHTGRR